MLKGYLCSGDAAAYRVYVDMLYRPTFLQGAQNIHIHTICCRITDTYNKPINFLTYNFSKEQYVLPEDDLMIETCRRVLNVLV